MYYIHILQTQTVLKSMRSSSFSAFILSLSLSLSRSSLNLILTSSCPLSRSFSLIETTDNPLRTITSTCFHAIEFLFYLLLCNCLYVLKMLFVSLNKTRNTDTQNPYAHFPSKRPFFSSFFRI